MSDSAEASAAVAARRARRAAIVSVASSLLEVAGIAVVAVGLGMWMLWVGVVAGGVGLILLGALLDPPARAEKR